MAGIRTLEHGFDKSVKSYSTPERVVAAVKKYTDRISGVCNVRVVPAGYGTLSPDSYPLRYTAILSCFSEEGDIFALARAGCPFVMHR